MIASVFEGLVCTLHLYTYSKPWTLEPVRLLPIPKQLQPPILRFFSSTPTLI